ncbi:MAG: lipoate--protein ligase family protein [Spirochaetes bacterium]|nr:lipoate--protein ligase family protein [Spirochaetota bacterium]
MHPTKKRPFRFIHTGASKGSINMAMDEAVFIGLREGHSTPVLRIYRWLPATISIGYFQNAGDIDFTRCREDGIGVVRRMTGGRAVLHNEELTYSMLFTEEDFHPFRKKEIFFFIARCLVDSLRALGIESKVAEKTRGDLKSANCFASPAQFEIESLEQGKLIGSAQVLKEGIVLQHGAIPLTGSYREISKYLASDSDFTKSISSLNQASDSSVDRTSLLSALKTGFGKHLLLEDSHLNGFEKTLTEQLSRDKYGTDAWTLRK